MDEVLSGLDFADILIGSSTPDEHLLHLHLVLQRLQQYGLVLNMEKCEIGRTPHHGGRGLPHHQARGGDPEFPAATGQESVAEFSGPCEFLPALHTGGGTDFAAAYGRPARRGGLDMDTGDESQL